MFLFGESKSEPRQIDLTYRSKNCRFASAKSLLKSINKNFGTLPFCRRYLDRVGETNYLFALNHLVAQRIVQDYPPLWDQRGSMTAQFVSALLYDMFLTYYS
jgi:methionyl aminopeptidase